MDRRLAPRTRVDLLFNKYIDGYPYLCRTIDVSPSGLLLERVGEPRIDRKFYPVEIGLIDPASEVIERVWVWAQQVWCDGERQALKFVGLEERDERKLMSLLMRATPLAASPATA